MARYYGKVGFGVTEETEPGIFELVMQERHYYGDVMRDSTKWEKGEGANDNLNIANKISIVADAYAYQFLYAIKYIEWMGIKWKVNTAEVERPRIILSIGGVWNGNQA